MMTGESVPVDVAEGDSVTAGTVAVSGRLIVGAAKVGSDTQLAHLVALVEDAQAQKAAIQRLADRISGVFVPVILVLAVLTLTGWLVAGSTGQQAFSAGLAVLIIACPCALGLATPAALVVASGRGAQLGIFIKGYQALESSRSVDTVVLDKTGTVTTGVMSVTGVASAAGTSRSGLLRHAGAVEQASEHAVAAAISAAACAELGSLPHADGFTALPGLGARGAVDGHDVIVGREKLLRDCGLDIPAGLAAQCVAWERAGCTVVLAGWDGQARGAVAVADTVKPSAAGAVAALRRLGLRTILLTGDNQATADAVAAEAGIGEVIAGAMPADKVAVITDLQAQGRSVAMVGDGVNDGPALAAADLGLAIGSGTDVAICAADMILLRDDLGTVPEAIKLARATLATIRRNLAWAFGYNIAAIPLAAAGFLNPLIAGAAMAASSVFVVANSVRLRRFGMPAAGLAPRLRPALAARGAARGRDRNKGAHGVMPGMNSGVNVNDPTVVAAFKAVLLHQGLIALLIFALLGLAWISVRAWQPFARNSAAQAPGTPAPVQAEPAWRQVLRIGFGLLWVFDGILQAQPKMAIGLPSQVLQPVAASSPRWVQHLVNWAGTSWSYHPMQAGASAVWIQAGIGIWMLVAAARHLVPAGGAGQRGLGAGGLGVRRILRRHLRAGPDVAVRRSGRGAPLLCRRRPGRAAQRAWRTPRLGRLVLAGMGVFLLGMAVLQAWPGRGFWQGSAARPAGHAGRHGQDDGRHPPAPHPVGLGECLRYRHRRARVRGQPVRRGRARRDWRSVRERAAEADPPGAGLLHGAVPGGLGAGRGLRLLRRPRHRPQQHDPLRAAGRRRVPGPRPRPPCQQAEPAAAGGSGVRGRLAGPGAARVAAPVGQPRPASSTVASAGARRADHPRRGPDGRGAGQPRRRHHPGRGDQRLQRPAEHPGSRVPPHRPARPDRHTGQPARQGGPADTPRRHLHDGLPADRAGVPGRRSAAGRRRRARRAGRDQLQPALHPGELHPGLRPPGRPGHRAELALPDRHPRPARTGLAPLRCGPGGDPARRIHDRPRGLRVRHRPIRPPAPGTGIRHRPRHPGDQVVVRRRTDRRRTATAGAR